MGAYNNPVHWGLRGTGDWNDDDLKPKTWRDLILYLYPNGDATLTALLAKMKSERTDAPEFNYWTKSLPDQTGAVTGVFTDAAMLSAYVSGGVKGTVLYIKCPDTTARHFRTGHQALLRCSTDYRVDTNGKVLGVSRSGDNSQIVVRLLQDDTGPVKDLSDCNRITVIGSINAEGSPLPDAITYEEVKHTNFTQIHMTSIEATRTWLRSKGRNVDNYKEMRREGLELHSIELERSFLYGVKTESIGTNGKPERTTDGFMNFIKSYGGNVSDYTLDEDFNGKTWLEGGGDWLDKWLAQIFRYGKNSRLGFCGYGVKLAINRYVKEHPNSYFEFTPKTKSYGINVTEWVSPFGTVDLITHPLFSYEETNANTLMLFDPTDLVYRYLDDTTFIPADDVLKNSSLAWFDGKKEGFLTEAGLEFHHPIKCGLLYNFGKDNLV